jgi:hypothetical protein
VWVRPPHPPQRIVIRPRILTARGRRT